MGTISEGLFKWLLEKIDYTFEEGTVKAEYDNGIITFEAKKNYSSEEVKFTMWEGQRQIQLSDAQEGCVISQMDTCYTRNYYEWAKDNHVELIDNARCDRFDDLRKEKRLNK